MTDNAAGFTELDDMIARLRKLPAMAAEAAPDIAHALSDELEAQIARGEDPQGRAWEERKAGGKALQNAGKALAVVAVGRVIYARLRGPEARHHLGNVRGGLARQILPRALTPRLGNAIRVVLSDHFRLTVGGAR